MAETISDTFSFFATNEWNFCTNQVDNLVNWMSQIDLETFHIDVKKINWENYLYTYNYGLNRYVLFETVEQPRFDRKNMIVEEI